MNSGIAEDWPLCIADYAFIDFLVKRLAVLGCIESGLRCFVGVGDLLLGLL